MLSGHIPQIPQLLQDLLLLCVAKDRIIAQTNAGVDVGGLTAEQLFAPLPLGIAAGLFFGKQIGIFGSVWLAVKLGIAGKLRGATWLQIYGVAMLCGIGFTMSLFIGGLAFPGNALLIEEAKIGILMGSLAAALVGFTVLRFAPLHHQHEVVRGQPGIESEIGAHGRHCTHGYCCTSPGCAVTFNAARNATRSVPWSK